MHANFVATGVLTTPKASSYLQQLCKHFAHKIPVRFDSASGEAELSPGPCRLTAAEDRLSVEVTASTPGDLEKAKSIIDSHLVRFAFREGFERLDWH